MTIVLPRKVLVVDDDPGARLLMGAALRKSGFEVTLADGGRDALRRFRPDDCDLVLLDVDMPDMNGYEVCASLRDHSGELLPIVMVTGMDDVQSVEKAYESGATDFIAKPINWALIGPRARYLLRSYQNVLDLRAAEARNAAILQAIPDLLFEVDIDGRYIDYHPPYGQPAHAPAERFIGRTLAEMLPQKAAQVCMEALQAARDNGSSIGMQYELPVEHGMCWFELSVSSKAVGAGEKPRFIVLARDITERKEAESNILQLASFDSLTGLPNRRSFLERLDREIARAKRSERQFGILFMDLDGFKQINDTLGHDMGDLILKGAADRLRQGMRPSDVVSRPTAAQTIDVARLGGDEFTALVLDVVNPEDLLVVARRIGDLMRQPFSLDGHEVMLSTSIGIALYPRDGEDGQTLLKHSDTAMYHAKETGRDNHQFYDASLTQAAMQRMELDARLRLALERREFSLVYQPQFDLGGGRIHAAEALIRWEHPTQGTIAPLAFIPRAEANGLIVPIGEWVLRTACAEAARWQRDGYRVSVAVNLSPVQFRDPNLVRMVTDVLAQTGLAPGLLELEVTEGMVMEDTEASMTTLNSPARAWRALRARRFRHRLFVAELSQAHAAGPPQDRPQLRQRAAARPREPRHRACHPGHGGRPRHQGHRRGRRDRRGGRHPAGAGLRRHAGLLLQPAGDGGRPRRPARRRRRARRRQPGRVLRGGLKRRGVARPAGPAPAPACGARAFRTRC